MPPEHKKIVDKINKLLSLATSSNQAEAESAAAKAYELLLRYNLSRSDLEQAKYIRRDEVGFPPTDPAYPHVAQILQLYFNVRVVRFNERDPILGMEMCNIAFMGEAHNVEIAAFVGTYLLRAFEGCWQEVRKGRNGLSKNVQYDFYCGMSQAIKERLDITRAKVEEDGAMVVSTQVPYALKAYTNEQFPALCYIRAGIGYLDGAAVSAGRAAGEGVRLQRGVSSSGGNGGKFLT